MVRYSHIEGKHSNTEGGGKDRKVKRTVVGGKGMYGLKLDREGRAVGESWGEG